MAERLDEQRMRLAAHLAAIDYLIATLLNTHYDLAGASEDEIMKAESNGLKRLGETPFAAAGDPAIAALYADELAEAVRKILRHARLLRAMPDTRS